MRLVIRNFLLLLLSTVLSTAENNHRKQLVVELSTFNNLNLIDLINTNQTTDKFSNFDLGVLSRAEYFNSVRSLSSVKNITKDQDEESKLDLAIIYPSVDIARPFIFTQLPIAFGVPDVIGFVNEETSRNHRKMWKEFSAKFSENVRLIDLTYTRFNPDYYDLLSEFENLRELRLSLHGTDFSIGTLGIPSRLEKLVVFNSRIDVGFIRSVGMLKSLKEITFVGCWLDEEVIMDRIKENEPSNADKPLELALGGNAEIFRNLCESLELVRYIDCDYRMLLVMENYEWRRLSELHLLGSLNTEANNNSFSEMSALNSILYLGVHSLPNLKKVIYSKHNMEERHVFKSSRNGESISRKEALSNRFESWYSDGHKGFDIIVDYPGIK